MDATVTDFRIFFARTDVGHGVALRLERGGRHVAGFVVPDSADLYPLGDAILRAATRLRYDGDRSGSILVSG
jgi:hypothetical protein